MIHVLGKAVKDYATMRYRIHFCDWVLTEFFLPLDMHISKPSLCCPVLAMRNADGIFATNASTLYPIAVLLSTFKAAQLQGPEIQIMGTKEQRRVHLEAHGGHTEVRPHSLPPSPASPNARISDLCGFSSTFQSGYRSIYISYPHTLYFCKDCYFFFLAR